MAKLKENKLPGLIWFNLLTFGFIGSVAWNIENMYFNTFLYNSVYNGASDAALKGTMEPTTAINLMVTLSAVTAVVTTFIAGTFSERMKNRKLFISVGYVVWGLVTAAFGFITRDNIANLFGLSDAVQILTVTVWAVIVMDMIMTFMGSTSNDSAFNAWTTDITTTKTRPAVETAFTIIGFVAMAVVMVVGSLAQSGTITYKLFFGGLGIVVAICGIIGFFTLKEPANKPVTAKSSSYWGDLFYGFRPSVVKENSKLYLTLACVCLFNCAFQVFFPYLIVYLQYVVLEKPENAALLNPISIPLIVVGVIAVAVLLAGVIILLKLAGKNKALGLVPGVACLIVGLLILSTSTNMFTMLIGIAPTFIGYLVLTIQLNATTRDFIPKDKVGLFQGIRMIFFVLIPMVVGPTIGNIACLSVGAKYINEYGVETTIPDAKMFLYSAIVAALVFIPLFALLKKGLNKKED